MGEHVDGRPDEDEHTTDAAELRLHDEGANEPVHDSDPQLRPGDAGDADDAPDQVGSEVEGPRSERERLVAQVRDEDEHGHDG